MWSLTDTHGIYLYFWPLYSDTDSYNYYSIGSSTSCVGCSNIPLGSWCNGGTFKINSQTDSSNTNCKNMFLAMDLTSKILTANFPYPNLKCTVSLKCDADQSIS